MEKRSIEYDALPSQKRFHESKARFKGFSGPVGSGKSQALCHEAIKLTFLNPGRTGLIGAPTFPMLRDATQKTMIEILDENGISYELSKAENILILRETGSRILFRSLDDFERLRGTNLAWFGVDELTYTPEEAWLRLQGRLRDPKAARLCGFAVWTPKGFDWVYRRFAAGEDAGYEMITAPAFENRHILEKVPDFYDRLRSSYDDVFYRQEVLGEYLNANSGLVYHAFRRDLHVKDVCLDIRRPLLWALDFNVDPMSSLIAQVVDREVLVAEELVLSRATTQQACEEFHSRMRGGPWKVIVYGDASGQRMQTTGSSDYQIIREYFRRAGFAPLEYRVPAANPSVRERVMLTNAKLMTADGAVEFRVSPGCKELIKDFEEVTFKTGSYVIDKEKDSRRTHLSDALGYLIWQECRPQAPIGEQGRRLL